MLDLSTNQLTGPLPPSWSQSPSLSYLYLSDNNFSGPLPCEWGVFPSLKMADVAGNPLLGALWEKGGIQEAPRCWLQNFCYIEGAFICLNRKGVRDGGKRGSGLGLGNGVGFSGPAAAIVLAKHVWGLVGGDGGWDAANTWRFNGLKGSIVNILSSSSTTDDGTISSSSSSSRAEVFHQDLVLKSSACEVYIYGESAHHINPKNLCDHGGSHLFAVATIWCAFLLLLLLMWVQAWRFKHHTSSSSSGRGFVAGVGFSEAAVPLLHDARVPRGAVWALSPAAAGGGGGGGSWWGKQRPQYYQQQQQQPSGVRTYGTPSNPAATTSSSSSFIPQSPSDYLPSALTTLPFRSSSAAAAAVAAGPSPFARAAGNPPHRTTSLPSSTTQTLPPAGAAAVIGAPSLPLLGAPSTPVSDSSHHHHQQQQQQYSRRRLHHQLSSMSSSSPLPAIAGAAVSESWFQYEILLPPLVLATEITVLSWLLVIWGLYPPHVKFWPSYVLLGFLLLPHFMVGFIVNFRLLAAACLPPALAAASPAPIQQVMPPGARSAIACYSFLAKAPCWVAYPAMLLLLLPCVVALTVICPLTLVLHLLGLVTKASVVRYLQLLQGCCALSQSPGAAVLLTVLFVMGNTPLEWAYLDGPLYYLPLLASMGNILVAWHVALYGGSLEHEWEEDLVAISER